jgi:hypothetical protein
MIAFIVMLPLIVVVEICLQLHQAYYTLWNVYFERNMQKYVELDYQLLERCGPWQLANNLLWLCFFLLLATSDNL